MTDFDTSLHLDGHLLDYRDREGDPVGLMDLLRSDPEFLAAVVKADTRPHLLRWFGDMGVERADPPWVPEVDRMGPLGANAAAVEWTWVGRHVVDATFNNTTASGRDVTVHGFSVISIENDRVQARHYIDWAGVYAQLGLTLNWRTPVTNEPPP